MLQSTGGWLWRWDFSAFVCAWDPRGRRWVLACRVASMHPAAHNSAIGPTVRAPIGCARVCEGHLFSSFSRREQQKNERYLARCHRASVRFAAVVGETTGGWGPSLEHFLRKLFRLFVPAIPARAPLCTRNCGGASRWEWRRPWVGSWAEPWCQ